MSVKGFQIGQNVEKYDYTELDNKPTIPSTAADVGAIAAPSSPATGAFLVWDGTAWVAQTVPSAQGVNF